MQMRVERLRTALKLVEPVVPKKTALPVTQSVLLQDGKVWATDLETALFIDLPEATEQCLIPIKMVMELIERVPGNLMLTLEVAKNKVSFSWEGGRASFVSSAPKDFPDLNRRDAPVVMTDVDGTELVKTMNAMVPYAATETSRPVLNSVAIRMGEKIATVGADGFRMVYSQLPISFGKEGTLLIPLKTVEILNYLWDKTPVMVSLKPGLIEQLMSKRMLTMAVGNGDGDSPTWIGFKFGTIKVVASLIQGTYPNTDQLFPHPNNKVKVLAPDLLRAVLRTKDIAANGSGIVRMRWEGDKMEVYAESAEFGDISTTIPAEALDGPSRIGINIKYLVEMLRGKDGMLTMGVVKDTMSSVQFEHSNSPVTLIMPMFVQWAD